MKPRNPQSGSEVSSPGTPRARRVPRVQGSEPILAAPPAAEATPPEPPPRRRRPSRRTRLLLLLAVSPLVLYACTSTFSSSRGLRLLPGFPDETAAHPATAGGAGMADEEESDSGRSGPSPIARPSPAAGEAAQVADPNVPNIWKRIRAGLRFAPAVDNPLVTEQIRWFASDPGSLRAVQRRAKPYLHFIVEELERRHLPMELALLPIVESAYRPLASSEDNAAGIWQFIPRTGRRYGLEENEWYDERRDIVQSTNAALDMLHQLSRSFHGDWELTLAAYNAGIGRVQEAMELNRLFDEPTDFWSLELPGETRFYVRRVLAIAHLVNHPQGWGIKLEPIPDHPYFAGVKLDRPLDLAVAAELSGTSVSELFQLNPGLKRWIAAVDGPQQLNVPADRADAFRAGLAQLKNAQRLHTRSYTLNDGDTLTRIALKYGIPEAEIRAANHPLEEPLQPGETIQIPLSALPLDRMALLEQALDSS